jgi:hypothetical protein
MNALDLSRYTSLSDAKIAISKSVYRWPKRLTWLLVPLLSICCLFPLMWIQYLLAGGFAGLDVTLLVVMYRGAVLQDEAALFFEDRLEERQ